MKKKRPVLLILILIILSLLLAKDIIVKTIFEHTIQSLSGLKITARSISVGIFNTSLSVKGMLIHNPASFREGLMAQINHLYINYDITSGLRNEILIKEMVFDVGLVNVVKNDKGENNLNSLKVVKALEDIDKNKKMNGSMPRLKIDRLHLKGARVTYKDYTKPPYPMVTEFKIDVDEEYENITNPYELVSIIVSRSLAKTGPSSVIGFDITPFQNYLHDTMSKGVEALKNFINVDKE